MPAATTSIQSVASAVAAYVARDSAADETVVQLKASAATVHKLLIDNRASGAVDIVIELFDEVAASVTLGTTAPWLWLTVKAGKTASMDLRNVTDGTGLATSTALSIAVVTAVNGVAGPAVSPVSVEVQFT